VPSSSFFLLGPRGTGKTTWLRQVLPDALWFDLLRTATFLDLSRDPETFRRQVEARSKGDWIVVDEIQRLPILTSERVSALRVSTPRNGRLPALPIQVPITVGRLVARMAIRVAAPRLELADY
jgi:predicted AAA+ superfamily ATPase